MRFLHTADWHLGRTLCSESLAGDQRHFLAQILGELSAAREAGTPYDALLVPGDVYDRAVPPPHAVAMLDEFLSAAAEGFPETHVFILAGNHDGPERIGFASRLLERSNIHVRAGTERLGEAVVVGGAAVYQIPFLMPGSFPDGPERSQRSLLERATAEIRGAHGKNHPDLPAVVCAHATVLGGGEDGDAATTIGTAQSVPPSLFDGFAYTALGHIHSHRHVSPTACYSGSPLAYTFDEAEEGRAAEKSFVSGEVGADGRLSTKRIPVRPLRPVVRLRGSFDELYRKEGPEAEKIGGCLIEMRCTDEDVVQQPKMLLSEKYPHLVSFVREAAEAGGGESIAERRRLVEAGAKDGGRGMFSRFLRETKGDALDEAEAEAEAELFAGILREAEDEVGGGL